MLPRIPAIFRAHLGFALLLLLTVPAATYAQGSEQTRPAPTGASSTDGLFAHARLGAYGMSFVNSGDVDGRGIGLRAGYGFSDLFTLYLGAEGAEVDGARGLEALDGEDEYALIHFDLGGRFHVRRGRTFVPYADLALSVVGIGHEGRGSGAVGDVAYGGAGLSLGGGVLYFLSSRVALDGGVLLTAGGLRVVEIDGARQDVEAGLTGARLHVGVTVYPFR